MADQRTVESAQRKNLRDVYRFLADDDYVKKYVMSGEGTYDAISMMDRFALTSAMEKCFVDPGRNH